VKVRAALIVAVASLVACAIFGAGSPERAQAATDCGLTAPANITTTTALNQATAVVNYPAPTSTGTCSTITCSPASGATYPIGVTLVTCSSSTSPPVKASFTITVNDTQPPVVTVPADVVVGNDPGAQNAAVSFPLATATDNAPGVTVACDHISGSLFHVGTTAVTCTARDRADNTAARAFNVTVEDREAPDSVLTNRPAASTKSKHAIFEFVALGPGTSTFQCQIDGAAFAPCASPFVAMVGRGSHIFAVSAIDAAGNADPTPASYSWKVKKKRKHR
jgi:hypothetical protein